MIADVSLEWTKLLIEDNRDKKNTARSAKNRRSHCGKRGGVKLPSDFMSKKELRNMNGEVKCYNINKPITWAEFKSMPDDLKKLYISSIRERFNSPPDKAIAEALQISETTFHRYIKSLGLCRGSDTGPLGRKWYNSESCANFKNWWNEVTDRGDVGTYKRLSEYDDIKAPWFKSSSLDPDGIKTETNNPESIDIEESPLMPTSGVLSFECAASEALDTVKQFLGSTKVHISISWSIKED